MKNTTSTEGGEKEMYVGWERPFKRVWADLRGGALSDQRGANVRRMSQEYEEGECTRSGQLERATFKEGSSRVLGGDFRTEALPDSGKQKVST